MPFGLSRKNHPAESSLPQDTRQGSFQVSRVSPPPFAPPVGPLLVSWRRFPQNRRPSHSSATALFLIPTLLFRPYPQCKRPPHCIEGKHSNRPADNCSSAPSGPRQRHPYLPLILTVSIFIAGFAILIPFEKEHLSTTFVRINLRGKRGGI